MSGCQTYRRGKTGDGKINRTVMCYVSRIVANDVRKPEMLEAVEGIGSRRTCLEPIEKARSAVTITGSAGRQCKRGAAEHGSLQRSLPRWRQSQRRMRYLKR
jgi:hypothetical protein